jgi:hypothetical protein
MTFESSRHLECFEHDIEFHGDEFRDCFSSETTDGESRDKIRAFKSDSLKSEIKYILSLT